MDKSWLIRKIEISDFSTWEKLHLTDVKSDELIGIVGGKLPFGERYFTWRQMKELAISFPQTCEIWEYNSGEKSWSKMCGRAGLVLLRGVKKPDVITGWNITLKMN
jgi:hypothetical protein